MKLSRLLTAEMKYRPMTSAVACLAVWIAAACVCGALLALKTYDLQTDAEILALQERAHERMAALENEARLFAKSLGFNIFVYNGNQDLSEFYSTDTSSHFLSIQQAKSLADSDFEFLNHLLPILRERYVWQERSRSVIIGGIQGEIYIKQQWQEPMEVELQQGEVQLGYDLSHDLNISSGETIRIGGDAYQVTAVRNRLGTKDDITIFMNLSDAQRLLNRPGQISGILALSCNCEAGDVEPIRRGVREIIPGADVVEFTVRAKAREQARKAIAETASRELKDIQESRATLRRTLSGFSLLFSGFITLVSIFLLLFLYGNNVRERKSEIAILRALGVSAASIHSLFMAKALILAFIGSFAGCITGMLAAGIFSPHYKSLPVSTLLVTTCAIVLISSFSSLLACWWPAHSAASRDPGLVLNES